MFLFVWPAAVEAAAAGLHHPDHLRREAAARLLIDAAPAGRCPGEASDSCATWHTITTESRGTRRFECATWHMARLGLTHDDPEALVRLVGEARADFEADVPRAASATRRTDLARWEGAGSRAAAAVAADRLGRDDAQAWVEGLWPPDFTPTGLLVELLTRPADGHGPEPFARFVQSSASDPARRPVAAVCATWHTPFSTDDPVVAAAAEALRTGVVPAGGDDFTLGLLRTAEAGPTAEPVTPVSSPAELFSAAISAVYDDSDGLASDVVRACGEWVGRHGAAADGADLVVLALVYLGEFDAAEDVARVADPGGLTLLVSRRLDPHRAVGMAAERAGDAGDPDLTREINAASAFVRRELQAPARPGGGPAVPVDLPDLTARLSLADGNAPRQAWDEVTAGSTDAWAWRWLRYRGVGGSEFVRRVEAASAHADGVLTRAGLALEHAPADPPTAGYEAAADVLRAGRFTAPLVPDDALRFYATWSARAGAAGFHVDAARAASAAAAGLMHPHLTPATDADRLLNRRLPRQVQAAAFSAAVSRAHMVRALDEGRLDDAHRCWERAVRLDPTDTSATILYVNALDDAGRRQDATAAFGRHLNLYQRALEAYPRAPSLNNSLAWLSARCGRRLESARRAAHTAVELDPANPAYLDTLAEVMLVQGETARAVDLMDRVVGLADVAGQMPVYVMRRKHLRSRAPDE